MDAADGRPITVADAETISTPISLLVLTGDRVLKFRKPIITDFCDFSTVAGRLRDCEREVELNRRLTDDVYLGVGRVDFAEESSDEAEPCVVMRRLPGDRLLSAMVAAGEDIGDATRAIARRLAAFHADAARVVATTDDDRATVERARWTSAVRQLRCTAQTAAADAVLDEIEWLVARWCRGRTVLFRTRFEDGFVRDGHGDLRAENIFCLDDGPRIIDCIEFDDALRRIDVATDLAFLVMDLRRLGRRGDAEILVAEYEHAAGAPVPRALLEHDVAYWALVRAKVTHLRAMQGDPSARVQAEMFERQALEQLRRSKVRLVLIGGLPGTGKTTLARHLAERTGWVVVSTDVVRKELAAVPITAHAHDRFGDGLYRVDRIAATYTELLRRAQRCLALGQSVILDASWSRSPTRADALALALVAEAALYEVRCTVDDEVARRRLVERAEAGHDASDADVDIAHRMAMTFASWPSAYSVDTAESVEQVTSQLCDEFGVTSADGSERITHPASSFSPRSAALNT